MIQIKSYMIKIVGKSVNDIDIIIKDTVIATFPCMGKNTFRPVCTGSAQCRCCTILTGLIPAVSA